MFAIVKQDHARQDVEGPGDPSVKAERQGLRQERSDVVDRPVCSPRGDPDHRAELPHREACHERDLTDIF